MFEHTMCSSNFHQLMKISFKQNCCKALGVDRCKCRQSVCVRNDLGGSCSNQTVSWCMPSVLRFSSAKHVVLLGVGRL